MEFKYQKIKKLDIKKWLQGGNSKIYLIILVVFLAAVIFALTSIKELSKNSQSNNNITQSDESDNNKETSALLTYTKKTHQVSLSHYLFLHVL